MVLSEKDPCIYSYLLAKLPQTNTKYIWMKHSMTVWYIKVTISSANSLTSVRTKYCVEFRAAKILTASLGTIDTQQFNRNFLAFNYLGVEFRWHLGCSFAIRVIEIYVKLSKFLTAKHEKSWVSEIILFPVSCTHVCKKSTNVSELYKRKATGQMWG